MEFASKHSHPFQPVFFLLAAACFLASLTAHGITWTNTAGGDFDDAGNWDPNDVPDTNAESALLPQIGGSYAVTLTESMFPSGLSNQAVHLNGLNSNSANTITLNASGTIGSPLNWTIGNPAQPGAGPGTNFLHVGRSSTLNLNYVNIDIDSALAHPANGGFYINIAAQLGFNAKLIATNSQIVLDTGPVAGAGQRGLTVGQGSELTMVNGLLRVKRTGGSTEANVSSDGSRMNLIDTEFEFDLFNVGFNAIVNVNNAGITVTNKINRAMSIQSGVINFGNAFIQHGISGSFDLSFVIPTSVGGSDIMNLTNTTLQLLNGGSILMNPLGAHPGGPRKVQMNLVDNSTILARDLRVGGTNSPAPAIDNYQVTMSGSNPNLVLSGNLELGNRTALANGGAGRLIMNSGGLVASNVLLGSSVADGYYEQLGGSATISNRVVFQKGTTVGAQRFIVDDGATLTFLGLGMELAGAGSFLVDSADWDTGGSFIFAPVPSISTQQLIVAGQDIGGNVLGYNNNFALGTLDLSAYDASDRLLVLDVGTFADPALYVESISAIATNALISSIDIYYLPELNPLLYAGGDSGKYLLTGGGFLLPIPEPGAAALVLVAVGLLFSRRRSSCSGGL